MDAKTHAQQIFTALVQAHMATHGQPDEALMSSFAMTAWKAALVFARTPANVG